MSLKKDLQSKAIYDSNVYGPEFGSGHDLRIADKCNQNKKSHCDFPGSYNFGNKYERNQQSLTVISGAPNGK